MAVYTGKKTLVVEDDFASRQFLKFLLREIGLESITAETGERALQVVEGETVDILLLDIALGPGMTGLELCKQLKMKTEFKSIPAIAVTAFSKEHLAEFEGAGFVDYLAKPYSIDQLKSLLNKYLS